MNKEQKLRYTELEAEHAIMVLKARIVRLELEIAENKQRIKFIENE